MVVKCVRRSALKQAGRYFVAVDSSGRNGWPFAHGRWATAEAVIRTAWSGERWTVSEYDGGLSHLRAAA